METTNSLVRILFPDYCCECSKYNHILCPTCCQELQSPNRHNIPDTLYLYPYKYPAISRVIQILKTRKNISIYTNFAELLNNYLLETLYDYSSIHSLHQLILVPVPASKERTEKYGFNQAALLSSALALTLDPHIICSHIPDLLVRKPTKKQATRQSKQDRFTNMAQAFELNLLYREVISGSTIIIIDDVITTGATMMAAKNILLTHGAKKVFSVAIAH